MPGSGVGNKHNGHGDEPHGIGLFLLLDGSAG